jgi:hypothetical protein
MSTWSTTPMFERDGGDSAPPWSPPPSHTPATLTAGRNLRRFVINRVPTSVGSVLAPTTAIVFGASSQ